MADQQEVLNDLLRDILKQIGNLRGAQIAHDYLLSNLFDDLIGKGVLDGDLVLHQFDAARKAIKGMESKLSDATLGGSIETLDALQKAIGRLPSSA